MLYNNKCKNCGIQFGYKGTNLLYCSSACHTLFTKETLRKKKESNPWLVFWKYKPTEMIIGSVTIDDLVDKEIYNVCNYHFKHDTFINNKNTK